MELAVWLIFWDDDLIEGRGGWYYKPAGIESRLWVYSSFWSLEWGSIMCKEIEGWHKDMNKWKIFIAMKKLQLCPAREFSVQSLVWVQHGVFLSSSLSPSPPPPPPPPSSRPPPRRSSAPPLLFLFLLLLLLLLKCIWLNIRPSGNLD